MKKRIALRRETLRSLTPPALTAARGGITGIVCTTIQASLTCPPSDLCTMNWTCFPTDVC